ncbi:hypothetical protein AB0J07_35320, partial [Microbispora rosea]
MHSAQHTRGGGGAALSRRTPSRAAPPTGRPRRTAPALCAGITVFALVTAIGAISKPDTGDR